MADWPSGKLYNQSMSRAHDSFNTALREKCLIDSDTTLLLAVSGGADSMVMLELFTSSSQPVSVAHFNHHIRTESGADAQLVERWCRQHGVPFYLGEGDVPAFAKAESLTLEEAARVLRYRFLSDCALKLGVSTLAVAHNADDQAETVLMHILRGSGLNGLGGLSYRSPLPYGEAGQHVIRPMLDLWREEIMTYALSRELPIAHDQTNQDTAHLRNRLRLELIPQLAAYNPNIKLALLRLAGISREGYGYIQSQIDAARQAIGAVTDVGEIVFLREPFLQLPAYMQKEVILSLMREREGQEGYDEPLIEKIRLLSARPTQHGQWMLGRDLWLGVDGQRVSLTKNKTSAPLSQYPQFSADKPLVLQGGGNVMLSNGWSIKIEMQQWRAGALDLPAAETAGNSIAMLDRDSIEGSLVVRRPVRGERFSPLGMTAGTQKLSDFFINQKVPAAYRQAFSLISDEAGVVWLPGLQIADRVKIKNTTTAVVVLRLLPPER